MPHLFFRHFWGTRHLPCTYHHAHTMDLPLPRPLDLAPSNISSTLTSSHSEMGHGDLKSCRTQQAVHLLPYHRTRARASRCCIRAGHFGPNVGGRAAFTPCRSRGTAGFLNIYLPTVWHFSRFKARACVAGSLVLCDYTCAVYTTIPPMPSVTRGIHLPTCYTVVDALYLYYNPFRTVDIALFSMGGIYLCLDICIPALSTGLFWRCRRPRA